MAKLDQKILGKISGSLGDITFRQRNGKNYIASRPSKFNAPQDRVSLDRRSRFALSVKIASIINSIPQLKIIWSFRVPAGSTLYNYLVKINYKQVDPETINENTYLTPLMGFGISVVSTDITAANIAVTAGAFGTRAGIDTGVEKSVQLFSILCLSDPLDSNLEKTFLIPLISEPQALAPEEQTTVNLPLSSQQGEIFSKYNLKKTIFAFITFDVENQPVHYSNTFSG